MCLTTFRSSQFFLAQAPIQLTMLVLNKFSHCLINVPLLNENMAYFKKKTLYIISSVSTFTKMGARRANSSFSSMDKLLYKISETRFYHGTRMQEFFSHFRTFIDYF